METYFEVHSEFNKQTILDMSRHVFGKKMWLIKVLCAIAAGLFLLLYLMEPMDTRYLIYVLGYLALLSFYMLYPRLRTAEVYKKTLKQFDGNVPSATLLFGEEITYSNGMMQLTIPYAKVKKVQLVKKNIFIRDQMGNCILFPADDVTKGTAPELLRFLKEKCPNVKIPE